MKAAVGGAMSQVVDQLVLLAKLYMCTGGVSAISVLGCDVRVRYELVPPSPNISVMHMSAHTAQVCTPVTQLAPRVHVHMLDALKIGSHQIGLGSSSLLTSLKDSGP